MFDLAYSKARQMIQRNRRALEKIVEELLEFEVLTGKVNVESRFHLTSWALRLVAEAAYQIIRNC